MLGSVYGLVCVVLLLDVSRTTEWNWYHVVCVRGSCTRVAHLEQSSMYR